MRTWSLSAGDPRTMVLSADFRFAEPDYLNDHTWEVTTGTGNSTALDIQTTYGLRARAMRIFPGFRLGGRNVSNPQKFASPPSLRLFYPNFLQLDFSPFKELDVSAEYWLPTSQSLACRMTFRNQTFLPLDFKFEICGVLTPLDGQSLATKRMQSVHVLTGRTSGLEPVVFLTGGPLPGPGPYASLMLDIKLEPGAFRIFTWVQAALPEAQASFDLARRTAARPWEQEKARILMTNSTQTVDIETGDPDWDATLAFSQTTALRLFYNPSDHLPYANMMLARQPDHGFSARGDGLDHPSSWNGLTVQDALYLADLLPGAPKLSAGLVRNFLSTLDETGFVDCRPGLAGQRGRWLAAPLLASLTLEIFNRTGDGEFLQQIFPGLLAFFNAWFDSAHDRDGDGFPEWDHPLQTGFEDNPAFNVMHREDQGADIRFFESPSLAACLYRECKSLMILAGELDLPIDLASLRARAGTLHDGIKKCRKKTTGFYHDRDRDSHIRPKTKLLMERTGPGVNQLKMEFKRPVRLLFHVSGNDQGSHQIVVSLSGRTCQEPFHEQLGQVDFSRGGDFFSATSRQVYKAIDKIAVTGLSPSQSLLVRTVDYLQEDQTGFLPLWAGVPGEKDARDLIQHKLFSPQDFWQPAGISTLGLSNDPPPPLESLEVQFPWNRLIGEGLLAYGRRSEACRLITRLMETSIRNLKQHGAFFNSYAARDGAGLGERNNLHGLAPVGLFLNTLGVQIISSNAVRLEGVNPFPWKVTIKYRGLVIHRSAEYTDIIFPDGQTARVTDAAACLVSRE